MGGRVLKLAEYFLLVSHPSHHHHFFNLYSYSWMPQATTCTA